MQRSWRQDSNKLTFIICQPLTTGDISYDEISQPISAGKYDGSENMIGDVNLFICNDEEDEEPVGDDEHSQQPRLVGEIEIMIAQQTMQGKGLGKAALEAFLDYVFTYEAAICTQYMNEPVGEGSIAPARPAADITPHQKSPTQTSFKYLRVKIGMDNTRSLRLFETLNFKKTSDHPNYFGELELRRHTRGDTQMDSGNARPGGRCCIFLEYKRQGG